MSRSIHEVLPERVPKSFTVRDLPESERPRERLAKHGAQALSSAKQAV